MRQGLHKSGGSPGTRYIDKLDHLSNAIHWEYLFIFMLVDLYITRARPIPGIGRKIQIIRVAHKSIHTVLTGFPELLYTHPHHPPPPPSPPRPLEPNPSRC